MGKPVIPLCPCCGERDRTILLPVNGDPKAPPLPFCDRCVGYHATLSPRPGRAVPEDIGPDVKRRRYRKGATPRLTGEAMQKGTPLSKGRRKSAPPEEGADAIAETRPAG